MNYMILLLKSCFILQISGASECADDSYAVKVKRMSCDHYYWHVFHEQLMMTGVICEQCDKKGRTAFIDSGSV